MLVNNEQCTNRFNVTEKLVKDIQSRFDISVKEGDLVDNCVMCECLLVLNDYALAHDFAIGSASESIIRTIYSELLLLKDDLQLSTVKSGDYINQY
jgi:hypothetical protein